MGYESLRRGGPEQPWWASAVDQAYGPRWRYLVKVILTTLRWWIERDDFSYNLRQSQSHEQGGWYHAAARHPRAVLAIAEDAEARARLAYCSMQIGNIAESVREYRKAVTEWEHPAIMLGARRKPSFETAMLRRPTVC